jgi:hypothetical protein
LGRSATAKKKVHIVGYFHGCITMHGFLNIKDENGSQQILGSNEVRFMLNAE